MSSVSARRAKGRPRLTDQDAALKASWLIEVGLALAHGRGAALESLGVTPTKALRLIRQRHRGRVGEFLGQDLGLILARIEHRHAAIAAPKHMPNVRTPTDVDSHRATAKRWLECDAVRQELVEAAAPSVRMRWAVEEVTQRNCPLKRAADRYAVDLRGLRRRVKAEIGARWQQAKGTVKRRRAMLVQVKHFSAAAHPPRS